MTTKSKLSGQKPVWTATGELESGEENNFQAPYQADASFENSDPQNRKKLSSYDESEPLDKKANQRSELESAKPSNSTLNHKEVPRAVTPEDEKQLGALNSPLGEEPV